MKCGFLILVIFFVNQTCFSDEIRKAPKSSLTAPLAELASPDGEPLQVSVVTESKVQALFSRITNETNIPFQYVADHCHARAHAMAQFLEREAGVIVGKVFIEGDLSVKDRASPTGHTDWKWHVAPILLVRTETGLVPMVIDPSVLDFAAPLDQWVKRISKGKVKTKFRVRYQYKGPDLKVGNWRAEDDADVTKELAMGRAFQQQEAAECDSRRDDITREIFRAIRQEKL